MHQRGEGGPKDPAEAVRLYTLGLANPYPNQEGQHSLGLMHYHGEGLPQDHVEASWLSNPSPNP